MRQVSDLHSVVLRQPHSSNSFEKIERAQSKMKSTKVMWQIMFVYRVKLTCLNAKIKDLNLPNFLC